MEEKKAEEPKEEKKPEQDKKAEESKDEKESKEEESPAPPPEIVLRVFMHCEGCARKVRRSLKGFPGQNHCFFFFCVLLMFFVSHVV